MELINPEETRPEKDVSAKSPVQPDFDSVEGTVNGEAEMSASGYIKLGKLYAKSSRFEEALNYYSRAIELDPSNQRYRYYRGVANYNLGNYSPALEDFISALKEQCSYRYDILNYTGAIKYHQGAHALAWDDLAMVLFYYEGDTDMLHLGKEDFERLLSFIGLDD